MWLGKTSLVTAHIIYRMPDHQSLLQDFIWQDYDTLPDFPTLRKFLLFWRDNIDGPLYDVRVGQILTRAQIIIDLHDFDFKGRPTC
jgi:uncharacterized protein Usg